jgi:hypothetical protein
VVGCLSLVKSYATDDLITANIDRGTHPSHVSGLPPNLDISASKSASRPNKKRRELSWHHVRLLANETGMEQRMNPQCLGAVNISGADVGQAEFPQR